VCILREIVVTVQPMSTDFDRPASERESLWQVASAITANGKFLAPACLLVRDGEVVRITEGPDESARKLDAVALVPGLINAHTHLEFSDLDEPLAAGVEFPDWIRAVINHRRARPAGDSRAAAIRQGWRECAANGTVAIGEIATSDAAFPDLAKCGGRGVVFREFIGLTDEAVTTGLETAREFVELEAVISPHLLRGFSPHAPYTLHSQLFRGLVELAIGRQVPVAMHLAETRDEIDLLARGRGGLVDLLQSLGLWRPELWEDFPTPLEYLKELSRCPRVLVVHGNYLEPREWDFLATQPHMSVVYCPRTHAAFGHALHPWRELRQRGVRVVIGTDSRASNPDLSVFRELQWLHHRHPEVDVRELIGMVTTDAAMALLAGETNGTVLAGTCTLVRPSWTFTEKDWNGLLEPTASVIDSPWERRGAR
jgi:cytosine/adenosine deaminase-related metal-dependent hydrolase